MRALQSTAQVGISLRVTMTYLWSISLRTEHALLCDPIPHTKQGQISTCASPVVSQSTLQSPTTLAQDRIARISSRHTMTMAFRGQWKHSSQYFVVLIPRRPSICSDTTRCRRGSPTPRSRMLKTQACVVLKYGIVLEVSARERRDILEDVCAPRYSPASRAFLRVRSILRSATRSLRTPTKIGNLYMKDQTVL